MTTQHFPGKPQAGEYALYHESYISLVSQDDILVALDQQRRDTVLLLSGRRALYVVEELIRTFADIVQ